MDADTEKAWCLECDAKTTHTDEGLTCLSCVERFSSTGMPYDYYAFEEKEIEE